MAIDTPKYLAYHSGALALGFSAGSVVFSVVGEPYNYNGLDGAAEIATGDNVTGLVELPGDTLAIFGKRVIRKVNGTDSSTYQLGTIAGNSSCFDYTACLIGADVLFTGVNGISTLQQSASYGDFVGTRVSHKISNWLRPKLVSTANGFESGGVAMAMVVRSKSQYRLVLSNGEVITVTITDGEFPVTFQNYGLAEIFVFHLLGLARLVITGKRRCSLGGMMQIYLPTHISLKLVGDLMVVRSLTTLTRIIHSSIPEHSTLALRRFGCMERVMASLPLM